MASIANNLPALTAQNNLNRTQVSFHRAVQRLSSGFRINSAQDDAAGIFLSESMRAKIKGQAQAIRNAQDGQSMIQVAEGALQTVNDILVRMKELAVQAANGIYGQNELDAMDLEYQGLMDELDKIGNTTSFNGKLLLDGSLAATTLQAGDSALAADQITIAAVATDVRSAALAGGFGDITTAANAITELGVIDDPTTNPPAGAIQIVANLRATLGSVANRLEYTMQSLSVSIENQTAAESRIRDADVAAEVSVMVKNQILAQAGMAVLAQSNAAPQSLLSLLR
jgi:flagellin